MIGRMVGRFHIVAALGSGGMATVWKAEDQLLHREVAVKILSEDLAVDPAARKRFLREARSGAALDHPGVPAVFDFGESDGQVFIALALVDGETLSTRAASSPMAIGEAVRVVGEAARALAHAHGRGVVHRDVTGRNIMVARDRRVYLLDFGLALAAGDSRITTGQAVIGTLPYLAPEVLQGRPADPRSDAYGLGVVLFEALTGTLPFTGNRSEALIYAVLHGDPASLRALRPEVSAELEALVLKAMARDPQRRFPSAEALADALSALPPTADHTVPVQPGPPPWRPAAPEATTEPPSWAARGATVLAILPFDTSAGAGGREADVALARSLAASLGDRLGRLPDVRTIPPSQLPAAAPDVDPQQLARDVGSNLLLSAAVRRSGYDVRVAWTLLDPWRRATVASGTVDGHDAALFRIEDELASQVRRALEFDHQPPDRAPGETPRDPAARERYLQALSHLQRRDNPASVNEAIALLEGLLESEGDSARVQGTLARAYLEKYQLTKDRVWETRAASACQRAIELEPRAPETLLAAGAMHLTAGRHEEALGEFREVLERIPDSVEALIGSARALQAAGRLEEAEATLRRATAAKPDDWRAFIYLGTLYFGQGRYSEAMTPYQRVTRLTPDNARAHYNLGATYFQLDRLDEALAAMRRSIEIQPTPHALMNLATVLFYLNRPAEAAEAYEKAIGLSPSDPLLWGSLGSIRRWIPGQEARAAEELRRGIGLMRERLDRNPNDADSWAWLAAWYANLREDGDSIRAIERALALAPRDVNCMVIAGTVYHWIGDRRMALNWFRKAVEYGYGMERLRRDPELAPLMEDPEFVRILEEGQARSRATAECTPTQEEPHGAQEEGSQEP